MARPSEQEIKDMREQAKLEQAYNKSLRMTAPAPAASAASMPVKKAKGGYVKSADGCVSKGKTRGKMV